MPSMSINQAQRWNPGEGGHINWLIEILANGGTIWRTIREIYLSKAAAVFGTEGNLFMTIQGMQ